MKNVNRLLGAILLISGTSIGAGMLLIPVTTCFAGFIPSIALIAFCWFFMLICAFLLMDVNLSMKGEINLISMAKKTLGSWGMIVSWITYLLLLYSLTAAYIAASSPVFLRVIREILHINVPDWTGPIPLLIIFGIFIYLGTRSADYLNRLLMLGLIVAYIILVMFIPPHINLEYLTHIDNKAVFFAFPILITSFGFHIIIPTLTTYLNHDRKKIALALILGSLIPFAIYVIWEFLVIGSIPLKGEYGLLKTWLDGSPSTFPLIKLLNKPIISTGAYLFSFFAIITSFIGVSLSLADFLSDGLKIKKTGTGRAIACILTFLPPLFFVYTYQRGFYVALQFAAVFVAIILCIIPALMAWTLKKKFYQKFIGRALIIIVLIISLIIIGFDLAEESGYLRHLIQDYLK